MDAGGKIEGHLPVFRNGGPKPSLGTAPKDAGNQFPLHDAEVVIEARWPAKSQKKSKVGEPGSEITGPGDNQEKGVYVGHGVAMQVPKRLESNVSMPVTGSEKSTRGENLGLPKSRDQKLVEQAMNMLLRRSGTIDAPETPIKDRIAAVMEFDGNGWTFKVGGKPIVQPTTEGIALLNQYKNEPGALIDPARTGKGVVQAYISRDYFPKLLDSVIGHLKTGTVYNDPVDLSQLDMVGFKEKVAGQMIIEAALIGRTDDTVLASRLRAQEENMNLENLPWLTIAKTIKGALKRADIYLFASDLNDNVSRLGIALTGPKLQDKPEDPARARLIKLAQTQRELREKKLGTKKE